MDSRLTYSKGSKIKLSFRNFNSPENINIILDMNYFYTNLNLGSCNREVTLHIVWIIEFHKSFVCEIQW
jgi:hypothetical protein